jgi:3-oxoacyl-[acyl-carrier protein] reductase
MNVSLTGKRAVVGGGSQGIGLAAAVELAALGAEIVLLARTEATLNQSVAVLPTPHNQHHTAVAVDMANTNALSVRIAEVVTAGPVHLLVNNTGGPPSGPLTEATPEAFLAAYQQHLLANHVLLQAMLPGMKESGFGRVVNVISTSVKQPLHGLGVSNTTRAAVANWAKTLATELGPWGITVNNVLPGATATERLSGLLAGKSARTGQTVQELEAEMLAEIPAGRFGLPQEIGAAVAFLCTPAAAYINGINLPVDGGRLGCL